MKNLFGRNFMETVLKNQTCSAKIFSKGAELKSLCVNGRELMWSADPTFWANTSPLLFPMIGTLKGGKTLINGKEYAISKHGFVRDFEHTAEKITDDTAVFSLSQNETTLAMFPFDFKFTIIYELTENGVKITQTVKNNSSEEMPYCIGCHPAFAAPGEFTDYRLEFSENETANIPYFNKVTGVYEPNNRRVIIENSKVMPLNHEMFYNDVLYMEHPASRSVSLLDKQNKGVRVDFPDFTGLGIWQFKDAPFLCIEPWCGSQDFEDCSGVFAEKQGIEILGAGEEKSYVYTISAV